MLRLGVDIRHRDRRSVRRQDGACHREAIELREDLAFELELLEDGLDDEVAVGEIGELGSERETRGGRVAFLLREPPLLDATRQVPVDRCSSAFAELLTDLAADGLEARLRADLCDPGPHRPEADHADLADLVHARASTQWKTTSPCPGSNCGTTSSRAGSRPQSRRSGRYNSPPSDAKNMGAPSQAGSMASPASPAPTA